MARQKKDNKEIVQSYIWTVAKYEANAYEKRIFYRILEAIQHETEGEKLQDLQIKKTLSDDRIFRMPTDLFLKDEKDQNYTRIKKALQKLRERSVEFDNGVVWKVRGIIEKPILEYKGFVEFEVCAEVYSCMLNFVKGHRKIELLTAMSFNSEYSMRFYELMSGQKTPLTYKIEDLKTMFQLQEKYKRNPDFINYVVKPAKRELDKKSPYSFEYGINKKGKEFYSITFYPVTIPTNKDETAEKKSLQKQISLSWVIDKVEREYLHDMGFSDQQIKNNLDTFEEAKKLLPDFMWELSVIKGKARDKKNTRGYIINALKGKIKDAKNRL
jgi:plasmid replication initiation protein